MIKNQKKIIISFFIILSILINIILNLKSGKFLDDVSIELKNNSSLNKNFPIELYYSSLFRTNNFTFPNDSCKVKLSRRYVKDISFKLYKNTNYSDKSILIKIGDDPINEVKLDSFSSDKQIKFSEIQNKTYLLEIINLKTFLEIFLLLFLPLAPLLFLTLLLILKLRQKIVMSDNLFDIKNNFNNQNVFIIFILFILFYFLFFIFKDLIHNTGRIVDLNNIMLRWQDEIKFSDGVEMPVMTVAFPIYLLLVYFFSVYFKFKIKVLSNLYSQYLIIITTFLLLSNVLFKTQQDNLISEYSFLIFFISSFAILYCVYFISSINISRLYVNAIFSMLLLLCFFLILLTNNKPFLPDYSYLMGPANKIISGDKLNTFYIQYNLLLTYLLVLMQKIKLNIIQIHIFFAFVSILWMYIYYLIANKIFNNKSNIILFVISIFIIRFFIGIDPISSPQATPLRLDLWALMILIILRFGIGSIYTILAFATYYIADDMFGFLYLMLFVCLYLLDLYQNKKFNFSIILKLIPIFIVLIFHYFIFNTLVSSAGKEYIGLNIGFLPISIHSLFWFILFLITFCFFYLIRKYNNIYIVLFIFGAVCIQLIYFFGRSHENNLYNISGIFILITFLTVDNINFLNKKKIASLSCFVLAGIIAINNARALDKVNLAKFKLNNNILVDDGNLDNEIDLIKHELTDFDKEKLIVFSNFDGYINYRIGIKQIGYFSTFDGHIFQDEAILFLKNNLEKNNRVVILFRPNFQFEIDVLNKNPIMNKLNKKFIVVHDSPRINELKLIDKFD